MGQSSEEAKNMVGNRYDLVLIASQRARELKRGDKTFLSGVNKHSVGVTALKEIEQGFVGREYLKKIQRARNM